MSQTSTVQLLEYTQVTKARAIDEDKGILYDLVALGPKSENGRDYLESTQRAALPLFEGRQSFANHTKKPGEEPSVYDLLGVWRECRVEGGKTRGNFHYLKTHPLAPRLVEAARRPELDGAFGFSINALGHGTHKNGRHVIEGLDQVLSIDLVSRPATTKGLYESRETSPVKKKLRDLIEHLKAGRPGYARGLKEMADSGIMSPDAEYSEPAAREGATEVGDHEQALMDAAKCVLDDGGLSTPEKLKRIKEILKIVDGGKGGGSEPAEGAAAEESRQLKLENAGLKLLLEAGIARPGKVLQKALAGCTSEAEMKTLIEESKGAQATGVRPGARSAPAGGNAGQAGAQSVQEQKAPDDPAKLGRWLRD